MKRLTLFVLLSASFPCATLAAEDVEKQLAIMQERMAQLEDKLVAVTDQLAASERRVAAQQAELTPTGDVDVAAGLAPFFDTIDVSGFIAASYLYNFNDPDGSTLAFSNAPVDTHHPDSNSFSLDEVWLTLQRSVSSEQRAGFRADFVYGKIGSLTSGDNVDGQAGNDFDLLQAYIQYLAPIGEGGVTFQAGKFMTLIGAEVVATRDNFNITRGQVYNRLQPISHVGILASTAIGPATVTFGFVDETRAFSALNADINKNKALLWGLAIANETLSGSFTGTYGSADSGQFTNVPSGDKEMILDFILKWSPSESFATYLNADYISSENSLTPTADFDGFGIAGAGRFAITERTGVAGRLEYLSLESETGADLALWEITGTVDHKLTEQLTLRGELRFDDELDDDAGVLGFIGDDLPSVEDDQFTAAVELLYGF